MIPETKYLKDARMENFRVRTIEVVGTTMESVRGTTMELAGTVAGGITSVAGTVAGGIASVAGTVVRGILWFARKILLCAGKILSFRGVTTHHAW